MAKYQLLYEFDENIKKVVQVYFNLQIFMVNFID